MYKSGLVRSLKIHGSTILSYSVTEDKGAISLLKSMLIPDFRYEPTFLTIISVEVLLGGSDLLKQD